MQSEETPRRRDAPPRRQQNHFTAQHGQSHSAQLQSPPVQHEHSAEQLPHAAQQPAAPA